MGTTHRPHQVQTHQPRELTEADYDIIHHSLGIEPLRVPGANRPWITVDHRIHTAAARFLKLRMRQARSTVDSNLRDLARYIDFLVNDRNLWHNDEWWSDTHVATLDDIHAYRHHLLHRSDTPVSRGRWNQINTVIKQYHEFCNAEYDFRLPWTPVTVPTRSGQFLVTSNGLSMRTKRGSVGVPLHPDQVDILLQAAVGVDDAGTDLGGLMIHRDLSLISFGLATGQRRNNLRLATIYEVPPPPPPGRSFTMVRVPDATAKGLAGSVAISFEHHLGRVRDFISGTRCLLTEESPRHHRPECPLLIIEADTRDWVAVDQTTGQQRRGQWVNTDEPTRVRMVAPDGSSPIIHLNEHGQFLSSDSCSRIVRDARTFAREHLDPGFPPVRLHDLRHTYAVHLAVCIFHERLADEVVGPAAAAFRERTVTDAVHAVQASLGHASADTTALYTTHATEHILSDTPPSRYLGEP